MKNKVSEKQRLEWAENPTTLELLRLVKDELKQIVNTPTPDCLIYGDPFKTHENIVELDTRANSFAILELALEGDWEYFEEEIDEE